MIMDNSNVKDPYYLITQTPPNLVKDNYYLHELQEKVDADWEYRPNRVWIEKEDGIGVEKYSPIEVVIQTVKNDKGEVVSDDWRNIVFRDIKYPHRIGMRYRFSYEFDLKEPDIYKNIWIALNQNSVTPTASQVICRCNGTIKSIWEDRGNGGKTSVHEEPVIQTTKLTSANFLYNEVAVDPKGQLTIIAQHNKYTEQYYINQRFVIGYDRVYKVTNIIKTDSLATYKAKDVGVMRIYLEMDQIGELDDMENRLAYNGRHEEPTPSETDGNYELVLVKPESVPTTFDEIEAKAQVLIDGNPSVNDKPVFNIEIKDINPDVTYEYELNKFCSYTYDEETDTYTIIKNEGLVDLRRKVVVTFTFTPPEKEELKVSFDLSLRPF